MSKNGTVDLGELWSDGLFLGAVLNSSTYEKWKVALFLY